MNQKSIRLRRPHTGQAVEERITGTTEEIPFVPDFPKYLPQKDGSRPKVQSTAASRSSVADTQYCHARVGDFEGQRENTRGPTTQPASIEGPDAALNERSSDTGSVSDIFKGPEEAVEEQISHKSNSEPGFANDRNKISIRCINFPAESVMFEEKSKSPSIAWRQEGVSRFRESKNQAPLAELDMTAEEMEYKPALDPHAVLELENAPSSIHILGTGAAGKYIAHALAGLADGPEVTLLLHKPLLIQQWHEEGSNIQLLRNGKLTTRSNFNIESSSFLRRSRPEQRFPGFGSQMEHTAEPPDTLIDCLVVTTEGHTTVAALSNIKHRLKRSSTICFIQDGLGVTNLVDSSVFPDPETRPSYMLGNISLDLVPTPRKFTLFEKEPGRICLTMVPRNMSAQVPRFSFTKARPSVKRIDYSWNPTSVFLMRTLSRTFDLRAVGLYPADFHVMQLQKLAINAVIGPLSVIYDCYNNELLCNYQVSRSIKLLVREISTILYRLPEVYRTAKIEKLFSAEKLESIIVGVLGKTGKNTTRMLQAVRNGERTDIDFYNGYLVRRAMELGIDCPHLEMIVAVVKGKQIIRNRGKGSFIPFRV